MALNFKLKRKRDTDLQPRKTRKLTDDEEEDAGSQSDAPDDDQNDDEWSGIAPQVVESTTSGTKPKKPPTGEELRAINDAKDLFRSSTFKLQIDALLPNIRPKPGRIPPLDRFLQILYGVLMGLSPTAPQHPLEASRKLLKKGISVPYCLPQPTQDTNWKVAFETPSDITLVGSWANKISVKGKDGSKFGVDLAVEMPSHLFQEKDYLNGRFFHKRAFYLASLAAGIQDAKNGLNVDVTYESASDDPRLTKLVLEPRQDDSPNDFTKLNARVCIIPVLPADSPIPIHRLSPSHANIRVSSDAENAPAPTPLYNSALLTTLTPKIHLLRTFTLKEQTASFADALALLRVWANQRGYGHGTRMCVRGFDSLGAWWSSLLGFLVFGEEPSGTSSKRKPLGKGLSSYQLFRAALDFLSRHDFAEPAFHKSQEGHKFPPDQYQAHHQAVFVDASSTVNLLSGLPIGSLQLLQHDARKTLEKLDDAPVGTDPFTHVFLNERRDLVTRFDTVIRVDLSSAKPRSSSLHTTLDFGSPANALISSMDNVLRQGLGNRTQAIIFLHPSPSTRPLSQALPTNPDVLYIGLIHDSQHAFRLVDHGPAADETDATIAERFRDFWGDKAELRRFKDGRIMESVVWDIKSTDERAQVPAMVVRYILQRHFGLEDAAAVQTWQSGFDEVVRLPESVSRVYTGSGAVVGFRGAMLAFDELARNLKALNKDLPLSVANVSPTSEYLRYTSVFNPVPLPSSLVPSLPQNARYIPAMEVVLQFEKSAKWPDELRAIQKIKLAFFERVANALMLAVPGLTASVVVGDGLNVSDIRDTARLEVLTADGWAFSVRIWHDREATLLDRLITGKNVLPHVNKPAEKKKGQEYQEAVDAKEVYLRNFIHAPRHHRAVALLNHRFAAYSSTVRLVKRWLASHWVLHGHVSEEAVEILCASFFVGDGRDLNVEPDQQGTERASVPGSKERGFATVVEFLKDWKWENGLFVPLYGAAVDGADPLTATSAGVWRISTEADREGRVWTMHGPDVMVAHRIRALAKATWSHLHGIEQGRLDVKSIFIHPTQDYDFVIGMNTAVLPRYAQNVDSSLAASKYANLARADAAWTPRPGFDPARLLYDDLKHVYADTFKIFCDPFGGDRFGAVWDPTLKQARPFRVLGGFSSMPVDSKGKDKGQVVLNEAGVLGEIERMGNGIVCDITVRK